MEDEAMSIWPGGGRLSTEIVAVVDPREGSGATTLVVNLALSLVATGRSVLVIDLDPEAKATRLMGAGALGRGGTRRILLEASLDRSMMIETRVADLYLASASAELSNVENELAMMGDSQTRLYQALLKSQNFDYVLLDCPPSMDLLTRNALAAAHRVLIPFSCVPREFEALPDLLTTITRLRAGLPQPFYGSYLLINRLTQEVAAQELAAALRRDYGRMTLLTEIPADDILRDAEARGQPIFAHSPDSAIAWAYLSAGAEWLTLGEPGNQSDGTWLFEARQKRMSEYCARMRETIDTWSLDSLSDVEDALRQKDAQALESLYQGSKPVSHFVVRLPRLPRLSKKAIRRILVSSFGFFSILSVIFWLSDVGHRIDLAAGFVGSSNYWMAGSFFLWKADSEAYRALIYAARLFEENKEQLMLCSESMIDGADTARVCMIRLPQAHDE
ncbi:ParA family protein [Thiorhodococcus fuscus]|uniref:ParA family protein n=1 Tax=Thiorhodococcus fuscus TaxID=527200 RepID=A0ABW4YE51_9GAMM